MKSLWVLIVALVFGHDAQAFPNFVTNPYTLYPPGCATLTQWQSAVYGENAVKFFEGRVFLSVAATGDERRAANLAAFRVACADAGRSVIRLEFTIPEDVNPGTYYQTPWVSAEVAPYWNIGMSLLQEPGTWGAGIEPWFHAQVFGGYDDWSGENGYDKTWVFLLDNSGPSAYTYTSGLMSAAQYNDSFRLHIAAGLEDGGNLFIDVPATDASIQANPSLPLNGRLSGVWVVDGAPDQGFVIAVSEIPLDAVPEPYEITETRLVLFLSWYAFDGNGAPMWLVGNADFTIGATHVTIPVMRVSNGELFGSKTADREQVGSATISANSCNDLTFQYDLSAAGLGAGSEHLQRLYAMEVAGYACRDLEARMQTMEP
jgi:hypothetical protein